MRDHEGQPPTDERLREYARPDFPWVDDLYRDTSALVHLSAKHWYITIAKTDDAERIAYFEVGVGSPRWPENELLKFLDFWIETTQAVLVIATAWAIMKEKMRKPGSEPVEDG